MDEENWVARLCQEVDIPLYSYWVELQRPHGDKRTGITREDYEDMTRRIRYRMYVEVFNLFQDSRRKLVMIGHHEDDRDENRLAELGKGTLIHIDGMERWHTQDNVDILRPLLHVRKQKLLDLATELHLFYMQDSTPTWSRRGWIRRVLDAESKFDPEKSLLPRLKALGQASEQFGRMLDKKLIQWKESGVTMFTHEGMKVASINIESLIDFETSFRDHFCTLVKLTADIAQDWNRMFQAYAADYPALSCPIQSIPSHSLDLGPFLFSRAFYALQLDSELMEGVLVGRRSLNHCWSCISRCKQDMLRGHLHQNCPYAFERKTRILYFTGPSGQTALEKDSTLFLRC